MTKKIVSTGVALSAIFMFIGCGGGSSDTTTATVPTGTAFYIDSAVSGVNYTCGSMSGITGSDGSFTFEVGGSCTFYLGDVALRSVDSGLLEDGKKVYETDVKIARILQSLDTDGNPDNGITLNADIIAALSDAGITSLPVTEEEMDVMLQVIEVNGGVVVTEDEAQAHLDITMEEAVAAGDIPPATTPPATTPPATTPPATLTELIVGRTVYQLCNGEVSSMTFQADGYIDSSVPYRIVGDIIYTTEDGEEKAHTVIQKSETHIKIDEGNGSFTWFYFTSNAATAGEASDCGGDDGGTPVPANDLVSGSVTFDGHAAANPEILTAGAWIRITPTEFIDSGYNSLQCEIAPNGSFGSNCVIHRDEDGIRAAFTAQGTTFSYGIFRDSNTNTYWDCDEDYFGGSGNIDVTLSVLTNITVYTDTFGSRTCP